MNKLILLITTCFIFSSASTFAKSDNFQSAKNLISSHIEFAKTTLDKQCEKLSKKIHKLEKKLGSLEASSSEMTSSEFNKRRTQLIEAIQKCEDQIAKLNQLKSTSDSIE